MDVPAFAGNGAATGTAAETAAGFIADAANIDPMRNLEQAAFPISFRLPGDTGKAFCPGTMGAEHQSGPRWA